MPPSADILAQLPHRPMEAWKWTDVTRSVDKESAGLSALMTPKFSATESVVISEQEAHPSDHIMGRLAQSFTDKRWMAYVSEGKSGELLIEDMNAGHGRIGVMIEKNAELTITEHLKGRSGAFSNIDLNIHMAEGAKLNRVIVQNDPDNHTRIATTRIAAAKGTQINQHCLSLGGALTRLETRLYGEGEGIEANINGAYLLSGNRHSDLTSYIQLSHPDCHIRQSVKGVVTDKARGVFQGKFHVERAAQHTDAEMRHDALMLSDRAEIRAKPELEIYADDVACAHGNTIGALDDSALFYMRQRGIPMAQAKALLTEAFIASVFDDLEDEEMKASLMGQVGQWLEASYDL